MCMDTYDVNYLAGGRGRDHGLDPEVVDSILHYHTKATEEFTRLSSRPGGISRAQRDETLS